MKKALTLCLLLIFVAGCIPQTEEPVKDAVVRAGGELSEALKNLKGELGSDEYLLTPMSKVFVEGREVVMKDMNFDYDILFTVDGQEYTVYETNKQEIVNGIEITVKKVNFDPEGVDTYIIAKLVTYIPGENEYLMYIDTVHKISDVEIKIAKFNADKSIELKIGDVSDRLVEGETKEIKSLTITNVITNLRAITSEKYSILRIEE